MPSYEDFENLTFREIKKKFETRLSDKGDKINEFITGSAKSYSVSSTGIGLDILNGQTVTTNNTDFKFKKLNTNNLKFTNGQEITIDIDVVDSGTGTAVFNGYDLTNKKVKLPCRLELMQEAF